MSLSINIRIYVIDVCVSDDVLDERAVHMWDGTRQQELSSHSLYRM
jgi:hypothetical protein